MFTFTSMTRKIITFSLISAQFAYFLPFTEFPNKNLSIIVTFLYVKLMIADLKLRKCYIQIFYFCEKHYIIKTHLQSTTTYLRNSFLCQFKTIFFIFKVCIYYKLMAALEKAVQSIVMKYFQIKFVN